MSDTTPFKLSSADKDAANEWINAQLAKAGLTPDLESVVGFHAFQAWQEATRRNEVEAAQRIAQQARENAAQGSARMRAGIRLAIGSLPTPGISLRSLPGKVLTKIKDHSPELYGLSKVPHLKSIQREVRAMDLERNEIASDMEEPASDACNQSEGTAS
jgi:hypothetical protein